MRKVPAAPMPVQTAYAVPIGNVALRLPQQRAACEHAESAATSPATRRSDDWLNLRPSGQPISSNPATMRSTHAVVTRLTHGLPHVLDRVIEMVQADHAQARKLEVHDDQYRS
jgi:hypothetical protein